MTDLPGTNHELLQEISDLKQKIKELELSETEHSHAGETLRARENLLNSIFRAVPTGIGVVRNRVVVAVNDRICEITGYTQAELVGKNSRVFYPSDADYEYVGTEKYRQITEHGTGTVETRWQCKDGRVIDVLLSSTPINPTDLAVGVTFTVLDITERKQAEKALKAIIDKNPLSIQIVDKEGYTLQTNASHTRLFGVEPPPDYSIFKDKQIMDQGFVELFERVKAGESVKLPDFYFNVHDVIPEYPDKPIWLRLVIFPLLDTTGGQEQYVLMHEDITERKHSEQTLKESELKFRTLFDAANDAIFIIKDLIFLDCNRKALDMFCCDKENIIGCSPIDFSPEIQTDGFLSSERAAEKINIALKGIPQCFEWKHRRMDGALFDTEVSLNAIGLGGNTYLQAIVRDITERKKAEEALRTSQVQLSEAMDLSKIVYWELDLADDMFIFNDSFYAFYGTNAEQEGGYRMSGKEYVKRFIHPDDQWNMSHRLGRNVPMPGIELLPDLEHRIVRRDGEVRHILARTKIVRDDSGRIIRRYGANQDITDRKRAEEAITKEKEKLKTLSDNAPFGMAIVDKEYHFTFLNKKFTELFGYDLTDVPDIETWRGKAFPDNEYRQTVVASVGEDFADARPGDRRPRVFAVTCKDGTQKTVQFIVSFLTSGDNLITFEDITELRRLENRLRQGQKVEAIGTLTGGIAHDFNNILTALMGYGALLKMAIKRGRQRGYVDQILSASQKAADLVQNLLAFSRQQTISLKPVSVNEIIRKTQNLLKRLLTEDIVIKTQLAAENIIIMADATQIDQILFNLATNARDAMPQGGAFTVETKAVELSEEFQHLHGYEKPGRYVLLSVSDTGVGIDEATREKIFDPFFTTKEVGKGTGLGLSTVYGIVKQHNGFINVYSEPNMGTTFHIYLPAIDKASKEEEPLAVPIVGGDETILVAEDSESVRGLIREMLTTYGYTVIEATDGVDAVDRFKKANRIDLLIFDSVMPKKNGREAYNEIRKIKQDIKVLFTSGHTRDVVLDKGIEDKKFNFLQKPIVPDILLRKVREALDNIPDPRQAEESLSVEPIE
jgi:PAS domain S-box-containing protein